MKLSRKNINLFANRTKLNLTAPGFMATLSLGDSHIHNKNCATKKCRKYKLGWEAGETTYSDTKSSFFFNINLLAKTLYIWGTFTRKTENENTGELAVSHTRHLV